VDRNPADGDELIAAAGPGGGPRVRVFGSDGSVQQDFFAAPVDFLGGVNVGVGPLGQLSTDTNANDVTQRNTGLSQAAAVAALNLVQAQGPGAVFNTLFANPMFTNGLTANGLSGTTFFNNGVFNPSALTTVNLPAFNTAFNNAFGTNAFNNSAFASAFGSVPTGLLGAIGTTGIGTGTGLLGTTGTGLGTLGTGALGTTGPLNTAGLPPTTTTLTGSGTTGLGVAGVPGTGFGSGLGAATLGTATTNSPGTVPFVDMNGQSTTSMFGTLSNSGTLSGDTTLSSSSLSNL